MFSSQAATISLTYRMIAYLNQLVTLCIVCFDIKYLSLYHSIVLRKEKFYFLNMINRPVFVMEMQYFLPVAGTESFKTNFIYFKLKIIV